MSAAAPRGRSRRIVTNVPQRDLRLATGVLTTVVPMTRALRRGADPNAPSSSAENRHGEPEIGAARLAPKNTPPEASPGYGGRSRRRKEARRRARRRTGPAGRPGDRSAGA